MTHRPWRETAPPRRILAIRLQATGDVVITLPYLRALAASLPEATIDFATRASDAPLARAVPLFDQVLALGGGRDERRQLLMTPTLVPRLLARRYDVVIDLQNNRVSRVLRRLARPRAWASFDRDSPLSAGERTRRTIAAAGFPLRQVVASLPLRQPDAGLPLLTPAGWVHTEPIVVLSPAGTQPSRQWPIERYAQFARLWRERTGARFVVLGIPKLQARAETLQQLMGGALINLVGQTTKEEAWSIVQRATLVVTEDCGLMHMAWTAGVPTLALFGASRHDWSAPLGGHSLCLHSGDLECGACMQPTCKFGDVHCLTRYTAAYVADRATELLARAAADTGRLV